jgi:hypothetical protein
LSERSRDYEDAAELFKFLSRLEPVQVRRAMQASRLPPTNWGTNSSSSLRSWKSETE